MAELVKYGKRNAAVREKAARLTEGLPQKDRIGEIRALFNYVQKHIRYIRDPRGVEILNYPDQIMQQEWGDCDDKSVLLASLLEAIGHPTRFAAVGFNAPGEYSHVFVDTIVGDKKWLSLDTTEPRPMGWRPPGIKSCLTWYN